MRPADIGWSLPRTRSELPPGGGPAQDKAFLAWLNETCETANREHLDACFRDLPDAELVTTWQLTGHLYKWLIGCTFPEGHGPTWNHRIRFVAVQFDLRRTAIEAETHTYLRGLRDDSGRTS
jgi:hypothetical protein